MEPGKFEREARLKLGERELKPSAGSWDKIAGSLEASERKTAGRKWYYIAAAVVVFAIISGGFLLNNNTTEPQIVEEPVKEIKTTPEIQENETPLQLAKAESENKAEKEEKAAITETPSKRKTLNSALTMERKEPDFKKELMPKSAVKISPKFQDDFEGYLAEAIEAREEGNLNETEVDQLLAEAAARLSKKYSKPDSREINAESLLADVENELDQSFRRKVFELLKDGFQEASYAFSNRNN